MIRRAHNSACRGFTVIEVLAILIILSVTAKLAVDSVGDADAGLRAERAARETAGAIRYARCKAMTDGVNYKVRFNVASKTISVVDTSNTVVAAPVPGSSMLINLTGNSDVSGVTMSCSLSGDTSDPYDVIYWPAGGTSNSGTVTFTYGGKSRTLTIPGVGDPTIAGDTRRP
jgi:Tfp pilus assembly protein FimT